MKKIISFLGIFVLVSQSSVVVSCSNSTNENYNKFMNYIEDKDTFVLLIDAKDDDTSNTIHSVLWDELDKGTEFSTEPEGSWETCYEGKFVSENIQRQNFRSDEATNLWKQDWTKDIIKWCGEESWKHSEGDTDLSNSQYVSDYENKFEKTPIFIFIKNGAYYGVKIESPIATNNDPNESWLTFSDWINNILIKGIWGGDDIPGSSYSS